MEIFHFFFFCLFPYFCIIFFILSSYFRIRHSPYTVKTFSSQMLDDKYFKLGSQLFHFGIINLGIGHILGLLTPHELYEFFGLTTPLKQKIEIVMGLTIGPITLLGLTLLIIRRLTVERIYINRLKGDLFVSILLWIQIFIGIFTVRFSLEHLDGSMMIKLTSWAQGIFTFKSNNWQTLISVPWIYKIHLIIGSIIFMILPFTRLIHIMSAPQLHTYIFRPFQIINRQRDERGIDE